MTYYSEDPYLAHYGVKGMKWGVHRSESHPKGIDRSKMAGPISVRANKRAAINNAYNKTWAAEEKNDNARVKLAAKEKAAYDKARSAGASKRTAKKLVNSKYGQARANLNAEQEKYYREHDAALARAKSRAKIDHKTNVRSQRSASLKTTFTTGKGIAEVILLGPGAAYGYNTARAAGASRVGAAASAYTVGAFGGALYRKISGQ